MSKAIFEVEAVTGAIIDDNYSLLKFYSQVENLPAWRKKRWEEQEIITQNAIVKAFKGSGGMIGR